MRKITKQAVNAFMNGNVLLSGNTAVTVDNDSKQVKMFLNGNLIAKRYNTHNSSIEVSNAGWFSNTTKERLNGLPNVGISQKQGVWYLNGVQWDGSWIAVK